MLLEAALITTFSVMTSYATEVGRNLTTRCYYSVYLFFAKIEMDDSIVVVGLKNSVVSNGDVGILMPWRKYYQKYPVMSTLELGEKEAVDCLELATKKTVLVRPTNVLGK